MQETQVSQFKYILCLHCYALGFCLLLILFEIISFSCNTQVHSVLVPSTAK